MSKLLPPLRVRVTTSLPSRGIRFSSLISGTNQAVSGSLGCTATGKPNTEGSTPVISVKVLPSSEETKMPLWCCTHMRCGAERHCARQCTSWAIGSCACSGGIYSARMPSPLSAPCAAAASVTPTRAGRDPDRHVLRVARVNADRVDARPIGAAAVPLFAQGVIPERAHDLPALAMIIGAEQAAGQRPAPDGAGLVRTAGRKGPDLGGRPIDLAAPHVRFLVALGLGRI